MALAELDARRARGLEPSVMDLGSYVAGEFRKMGVEGDRGPLSGMSIKRWALGHIKPRKRH